MDESNGNSSAKDYKIKRLIVSISFYYNIVVRTVLGEERETKERSEEQEGWVPWLV